MMGLFEKQAAPEPAVTGTDILRDATRSRRQKGHLGILARDLHVSISDLEAFTDNGRPLPEPVLQALAKEFFNAELDIAANRLRSLNNAAPKLMGIAPAPLDRNAVTYPPRADPKARHYINPGPPMIPSQLQAAKRPGWL
jgi:hypothetical protein